MIILSIIMGGITGFLGWCGGRDAKQYPKFPAWLLASWVRDWGISVFCALFALLLGVHSWWLLVMIAATGGALSTYWDFLFGYDNFWFHGFIVGVASFPIVIVTGHWWLFAARCLILAVLMGGWSALIKNADIEEAGRYFFPGVTLFMIC